MKNDILKLLFHYYLLPDHIQYCGKNSVWVWNDMRALINEEIFIFLFAVLLHCSIPMPCNYMCYQYGHTVAWIHNIAISLIQPFTQVITLINACGRKIMSFQK